MILKTEKVARRKCCVSCEKLVYNQLQVIQAEKSHLEKSIILVNCVHQKLQNQNVTQVSHNFAQFIRV